MGREARKGYLGNYAPPFGGGVGGGAAISLSLILRPSLWGRGKGEGLLSLSHFTPLPFGEGKGEGFILNPAQIPIPFNILL